MSTMSCYAATSSKEKEEKRLNDGTALVQNVWGVSVRDAVPDIDDLRPPNLETPSKRFIRALAAVAGKFPDLATAQRHMKERRDTRLAQDLTKQGRRASYLTILDLKTLVEESCEKAEKEREREVQAAYGLRTTRKPSFKAADSSAISNKRQKLVKAENEKDGSAVIADGVKVTDKAEQIGAIEALCAAEGIPSSTTPKVEQVETSATGAEQPGVGQQEARAEQPPVLAAEELPVLAGAVLCECKALSKLKEFAGSIMASIRYRTEMRDFEERMILMGAADQLEDRMMTALNEYLGVLNLVDSNVDGIVEGIIAGYGG